MSRSRHFWRFVVFTEPGNGVRDRGWGYTRAAAEADIRRKYSKQGETVVAIDVVEGPICELVTAPHRHPQHEAHG